MLGLQSGLHLDLFVRFTGGKQFGNQNLKVARKMRGCPRYKVRTWKKKKRGKWGEGEAEGSQWRGITKTANERSGPERPA